MNKKIIISIISLFLLTVLALPSLVGAVATLDLGVNYGAETGLGTKDVRTTIATIINVFLGLLGIIAVIIILVGGFKYMIAGGNEENVTKAKQLMFSGAIGLAIILAAYAVAKFVLEKLQTATT